MSALTRARKARKDESCARRPSRAPRTAFYPAHVAASTLAALDEATRAGLVREIRELAETHPDLRGRRPLWMPYETWLYGCVRLGA